MPRATTAPEDVKASDLPWNFVKLSHPNHHQKIVFRSLSEARARGWLISRCPRGSEMYLQLPDGTTEHYEAERQGDMGTDTELWQPFDPDTWIPPDSNPPPGETAWSDKEG